MKLHDPNFLSFDGEPITGRAPPQLLVYGNNGLLTQGQHGAVTHAYKLFRDALRLAVDQAYLVQNRILEDGTKVRMISISGHDQVFVWPGSGEQVARLPHGFLVTSTYSVPKIYCKAVGDTGAVWVFSGEHVPQAGKAIRATNQLFVPPASGSPLGKAIIHPAVLTEGARVWDWARHAGAPDGVECVPINLVVQQPGKPNVMKHLPHYAVGDKIVNLAGATLFQMPDVMPGWLPIEEYGPPVKMTPATDSMGLLAGLYTYRQSQIGVTDRYYLQFRNVVVNRTDDALYLPNGDPADTQFEIPQWSGQTTAWNAVTADLDGDVAPLGILKVIQTWATSPISSPTAGTYRWTYSFGAGYGWQTYGNPDNDPLYGECYYTETALANGTIAASLSGYTDKQKTAAGAPTDLPFIRLPWTSSAMQARLLVNVAYPVDKYMRGGYATAAFPYTGMPAQYGTKACRIDRRDSNYAQTGNVDITLALPSSPSFSWNTALKLFEGVSSGALTGNKRLDKHTQFVDTMMWSGSPIWTSILIAGASPTWDNNEGYEGCEYVIHVGGDIYYTGPPYAEGTLLYRFAAIQAALHAADQGPRIQALKNQGNNEITDVDTLQAPSCAGDYDYTSRYIIDFDLRALFSAAIVVRVQCSGAKWDQVPAAYIGALGVTQDPTYTVTISVETNTNGATATKELLTGTCTRPASFEFTQLRYTNPYYWPYLGEDVDLVFYMPPQLSPDLQFYQQLKALTKYQGSDSNLAGEDFFKADGGAPAFPGAESKKGIEFSFIHDGREIPHNKYVQGTLYARTFKLSDFPEALWMLHALAIDAPLNNFYPIDGTPVVMWHYLPDMGAAIAATEFSIETRDGVIVDWTADIQPKTPATVVPPLKSDRKIKLYRI